MAALPDPEVSITIDRGEWPSEAPAAVAEAAGHALRCALPAVPTALVLDITLTDDGEQRRLNRTWRGKDAPTNVLAFPATDPAAAPPPGVPCLLGDVVLALGTIRREAAEQDKPFIDHLRHLVVHGVLHLLGHDHQNPAEAAAMETREIAILAELGVPDPYRDTI
ncbi:MAG: rRNA maturation RNase YbeY [Stellaceae bacterium]